MYEGQMPRRLWGEAEDDFIWSNAHPAIEYFFNLVKVKQDRIVGQIHSTTIDDGNEKSFKELWEEKIKL